MTNDCDDLSPLLLRAADGALAPADRERLDAHLATCASCRDTLAAHAAVHEALGGVGLPRVSAGFAARVRGRLTPLGWFDVVNWRSWTLRLAPVAAALCVVAWWAGNASSAPSLASTLTAWTAGASQAHQVLLDPSASTDALLSAAFPEATR